MMPNHKLTGSRLSINILLVASITAIVLAVFFFLKAQYSTAEKAGGQVIEGINVLLPNNDFSALFFDDKYIWAGGSEGVYLIDPQTSEIVQKLSPDIKMIYNASICRTPDGSVWIGHENGIVVLKDDIRTNYTSPQIPEGRVNILVCDAEGGIWAGLQKGAVHFQRSENGYVIDNILTSSSGLLSDNVNVISVDRENRIWFGSYLTKRNGGLSTFKDGTWQYYTMDQGLPHSYINAILPIEGKYVLVGTGYLDRGGLALFENNGTVIDLRIVHSVSSGLPGAKVRHLFLDSKGHLWITTESDGLLICNSYEELFNEKLDGVYLTTNEGLSDNEIKTIIEAGGYYWLGGKIGLTRIDSSVIERLIIDRND